jgi:hypothetical protein
MKFIESNMEFDFTSFDFAEKYDTQSSQCAGLKVVDFVAEDSGSQFFIGAKNYANESRDPLVQVNMDYLGIL